MYFLQPNSHHLIYTGRIGAAQQFLAAHYDKLFITVIFDAEGDLRDVIEQPLVEINRDNPLDFLENKFSNMSLTIEAIKVKRFSLENYRIGVQDFPDDVEEYLRDKDKYDYSEDERSEFEAELAMWKEGTDFVFWCASDGLIIAS